MFDRKSIVYVLTNIFGKGLAAISQLYAIFVFTKMHTQNEAAVIFLLLGYATWFQMLEFGLAQALQNKFNAKQLSIDSMLATIIFHYVCMLVVAIFVITTPFLSDLLLPANRVASGSIEAKAFSIGAAMLLIASNNVITQRLLLVANQGRLGNVLIMSQAVLSILGVAWYQALGNANLFVAFLVYLGPQLVVFMPLILSLVYRYQRKKSKAESGKGREIFCYTLGFCGLGMLSSVFLGADYYFAAHYLTSEQVVSYHLATRLFFISYVVYYAYVQHRSKRLSAFSFGPLAIPIATIFNGATVIGLGFVSAVYLAAALMDQLGVFNTMTNGKGIGQGLLFWAFLYFTVRVCRDVGLVIAFGLNARAVIYKVYVIEVVVGLGLMSVIVPRYAGLGIFASMMIACLLGLFLLVLQAKQRGFAFVKSKHDKFSSSAGV
jgi:hypothetical protein